MEDFLTSKAKDNKALWLPRWLLLVVFSLLFLVGIMMPWIQFQDFLVFFILLFAIFTLTFYMPMLSGVLYIIIGVFSLTPRARFANTILFGIDIIPFSGLRYLYLDILGMDVIPFTMLMLCIAGVLLIILNFFPTLFGLFKPSQPILPKKEKNYWHWIPRSISLLSILVLIYFYYQKNFGTFGSGYRDPLIEILIAFLVVALIVSVWAKKYIAILYFLISFTGFLMVYLPLLRSGSSSSGSPLEHNISIYVVLLVSVLLVTALFYVFSRNPKKSKDLQTHNLP
jgi:hypothetical protein